MRGVPAHLGGQWGTEKEVKMVTGSETVETLSWAQYRVSS